MPKKLKLITPTLSDKDLRVAEDYLQKLLRSRNTSEYVEGRIGSIVDSLSLLADIINDIE